MSISGSVLGVCLALASTPNSQVFIAADKFTLAWNHSIEKVRWEENYSVIKNKDNQAQLLAGIARIKGSAAGMEPPPDAVLNNAWYEYQPDQYPSIPLRLTRSGFTPDYEFCVDNSCNAMESILASDGGITLLYPCIKE